MTKVWSEDHWTEYEQGIIAAEREKVAKWMIAKGYATGHGESIEDLLKELEWQIEEKLTSAPFNPKPPRLFSLQVGDTFVLRRNKKVYTLVELQWTPGMGTQYICKNLKTGKTERLHHSVLVDKAEKGV